MLKAFCKSIVVMVANSVNALMPLNYTLKVTKMFYIYISTIKKKILSIPFLPIALHFN